MPRPAPNRRLPPHPRRRHRPVLHRAHGGPIQPLRGADLGLALLGVALLGGLAWGAALRLAAP
ncbi:hypothetical protein [Methylobacterium sp. Leaf118]|uniref:hypothetical protein n=1 Tax=Methylobacterium sp. Leaf118 TaxID=2876562 RepID=UPI001E2C2E3F|nr:hypothetical protein [Methylobacterium sp. Leaf118]